VIIPDTPLQAASLSLIVWYAISKYEKIFNISSTLNDIAQLNPFLAKYDWLNIISDLLPVLVNAWVSLKDNQNNNFLELTAAVHDYYESIFSHIGNLSKYTTIL
jgi:hypothetical protein